MSNFYIISNIDGSESRCPLCTTGLTKAKAFMRRIATSEPEREAKAATLLLNRNATALEL